MKTAEYIASALADWGVRHVFMITGGGAMFLNYAFGHEKRIQYISNHHEQACAMAAEGYARITNQPGVICVTTGPGGINALNGVFGAWVDSIPMLIISGQVKRETCLANYQIPGLRQIGDQEADIVSIVKGITKYAVMITDPESIRYHLEKAWFLSRSGRPGPCWIDIPIDIQSASIEPTELVGFHPDQEYPQNHNNSLEPISHEVIQKISSAERPVILAGKGIRLANALGDFNSLIKRLQIPVVAAWTGIDLISYDHPLYCGCSADIGTRAGNFSVQNSDLLIVIGSRLSLRQVTYNWQSFARYAYKIQVDIDPIEMKKPTTRIDFPIICDAGKFLEAMLVELNRMDYQPSHKKWLEWCKKRLERYPVIQSKHRTSRGKYINPYHFAEQVFDLLKPDDIVVCGNGAANVVTFQAAKIKAGQRLFCNTGDASMGYDLPAAIGASIAANGRRVICMAGDGSIQFNIQELQTLKRLQLPIIVFIYNNNGYLSIRLSQINFFRELVGEGPTSGVTFPDIVHIAKAYGLKSFRLSAENFDEGLKTALSEQGPLIVDVLLDPEQPFEPKVSSKQLPDGKIVSAPMEDMYPFLPRKELLDNLLIPPFVPS